MSNVTTTTAIKWQSDTTQASSNIHPHPGQKLTNKIDIKADSSFCYIQGIKRKILYTSKLVYCHYTWIYAVLICLIFMWFCIISSWLWAPEEDAGKCIELQCAIKVNKMSFLEVWSLQTLEYHFILLYILHYYEYDPIHFLFLFSTISLFSQLF